MANILEKYGIKEVADVTFYDIDGNGNPTNPVLYLDTLKVSTIEQTAELAEARGGKGNVSLVAWDYGKEINVTLEDALFSAKSMAIMFGKGKTDESTYNSMMRTQEWVCKDASALPTTFTFEEHGTTYTATSVTVYDAATGASITQSTSLELDKPYFMTGLVDIKAKSRIRIDADSFPGTYYITGDTYARSAVSGADEFFQFIIHKAKVTAENTITLEAEGDPSVFNLNLRVLRPADKKIPMMELVKYDLNAAPNP